jgi:lipopolysaccharide transport system permease protein
METIIRPKKTFDIREVQEVWQYRELLYFMVWRDLKVRYKQTSIGVGWAIFQPFVMMVVFSIFFGTLAKIPSDNVPYPIFVYVGLLFWQFFSSALTEASNSLLSNTAIITKVYFPRIILPIAATLVKFADFFFASIILVGLMFYYGYAPNLSGILLFPLLLLITFLAALGGGLFLASINVKYRDVRYALPFFIQMLLFVTPVIYPASNPMTGVIKAARGSLLGTEPINWLLIGLSAMAVSVALTVGYVTFKKTERYFADVI